MSQRDGKGKMSDFRFIHMGDEHIDADNHGKINPVTGLNTLWESTSRALLHVANTAVDRKVEALISAGDLFKTGRPSAEAIMLYVESLMPAIKAGIIIVILDGNHHKTGVPMDHRTVIHAIAEIIRAHGGTAIVASDPGLIRLASGAQIAALPWLSKNHILNHLGFSDLPPQEGDTKLAEYAMNSLEKMAQEADASSPLIMASHVTVDDVQIDNLSKGAHRGSEMDLASLFSEPVLDRRGIDELPFAYGALGHIHTPQSFGEKVHYAGSLNRITFTDMPDEKGVNLVTVTEGGTATVERIPVPARIMAEVDLERADYETVLDSLQQHTLVRLVLETGNPEAPKRVVDAIHAAGAILADTKPRPAPRSEPIVYNLPEDVTPLEALRTWAEHNAPRDIDTDTLVDQYARKIAVEA